MALVALLAAVPAQAATTPRYLGAMTHPFWSGSTDAIVDQELDRLAEAGANTVRVDIAWSSLELNGKGIYSSSYTAKVDRLMNAAAARGIKPIPVLYTTPCWASSAPETDKQGCAGAWWDRKVQYHAPINPADYADAAAWVAQRWGSKMAALEVWNEPNLEYSLISSAPAAEYAAILKAAYPKIKAAAPSLPVLGPGMAFSDGDFLEQLYAQGIKGSFDGLSLHPYNEWRDPYDPWQPAWKKYSLLTGVPWIKSILDKHGDGAKKLWLTELGWSSCLPGGTGSWCVDEAKQAQYVADSLRVIRDSFDYVEAVVIYNLRNKGTDLTDRESSFGLLYRDFTPKPAYASWKAAMKELLTGTAVPTPTPQPVPEPTPQPIPEPTPNPTPNPTPEPTPNPTPEPTPNPTPEPTPNPTPEPTPNPTPQPVTNPPTTPVPEPGPIADPATPLPVPPLPPVAPVNQAPAVTLTRPAARSTFGPNICMAAGASDDSAVTKVEFRVDGKLVATDTAAPYAAGWSASSKTSYANHTVSATAYDAAGLKTKSEVTVKRTKTAPRCTASPSALTAAARRAAAKRLAAKRALRRAAKRRARR